MHRLPRRSTIYAGVLAACCGGRLAATAQAAPSARPVPPVRPAVSSPANQSAPSRNESNWDVLGRSVEDRVIEFRQFGQGDRQVLVVGPLEGDETTGVELLERLAEHLERFPRWASGVTVTLVRDPNPDGRLRRSANNARGVRLDRNFPTRGWRKVPSGAIWLSGREPDSEPETRALVDLLSDLHPDRIVILAGTRRRAELAYAGPAETLSRDFAKSCGLRPAPLNVAAEQGSLAVYAGADRQTPTLVVRVSAGMPRDQLWDTYKRSLLAAIGEEADASEAAQSGRPATSVEPPGSASPIEAGQSPPSMSRPLAALAATKRLPTAAIGQPAQTAVTIEPRILSADDLLYGGTLAPVVRAGPRTQPGTPTRKLAPAASSSKTAGPPAAPARRGAPLPRQFGPVAPQTLTAAPRQKAALTRPAHPARAGWRGFPPVSLSPSGANSSLRPSLAPPAAVTSPGLKMVERLPTFDPSSSPARTLPAPIPLYPETGY